MRGEGVHFSRLGPDTLISFARVNDFFPPNQVILYLFKIIAPPRRLMKFWTRYLHPCGSSCCFTWAAPRTTSFSRPESVRCLVLPPFSYCYCFLPPSFFSTGDLSLSKSHGYTLLDFFFAILFNHVVVKCPG